MPKMLDDGAVEYEDGTPAIEAHMGKDVPFLSWVAEPKMEERKLVEAHLNMIMKENHEYAVRRTTEATRLSEEVEMDAQNISLVEKEADEFLKNAKKFGSSNHDKTEKRDGKRVGEGVNGRVAPRNPSLAVYGGGLEDVSAFLDSGSYDL